MLEKLKSIFICNGFDPEVIMPLRNELVDVTADNLKKLAMGIGMLYLFALIADRNTAHMSVDLMYIVGNVIFLFMIFLFRKKKNYYIAEAAIVFFVFVTFSIAIYESTILCQNSRGSFFPLFLVLIAVMFNGNPIVIDVTMFVMTSIFLILSYRVKSSVYFQQDLFIGVFTLLISNMVNAMVSRYRISNLIKTREAEENWKQYMALYNTVPCGIMEFKIVGDKELVQNINLSGLRLFGYSRKEELIKLKDFCVEDRTHPDDRQQITQCIRSLKKMGDSSDYEYRIKQKNGTYVWVVGKIYVTAEDEEGITVLSAYINIDAEKKAINANEAKSKFLSRMSHDIRTPMNAIIGLTKLVLDNPHLDGETTEKMKSIQSSSRFLLGLINDILDVSKIEADEMKLHWEPYDKNEFLNYLETMIRPLCEEKNITFVVDTVKTSHPYVLLDKIRFNQVFFNLLSNAVKFTPSGGLVKVLIENTKDDGTYLAEHIMISDTGIGMSKQFQKHMFDPFSQENTEHIIETQGSGLGLAIVKRIVELMNGTMKVESAPGLGTTYHLYLKLKICEKVEDEVAEESKESLNGKCVLVCEDHPVNRQITEALLNKVGIQVEFAFDGSEGVQKFLKAPRGYYKTILMDIRMPKMNGIEATKAIRRSNHPDAKIIPIIAMTANAFDTDRADVMEAGMNEHIAKPIDADILYRTLVQYVGV